MHDRAIVGRGELYTIEVNPCDLSGHFVTLCQYTCTVLEYHANLIDLHIVVCSWGLGYCNV